MRRIVYQILFPLTTAMIWGISFVAQSTSADHIGAFTFNAARCFAGFLALLVLIPLFRRFGKQRRIGGIDLIVTCIITAYRRRGRGDRFGACGGLDPACNHYSGNTCGHNNSQRAHCANDHCLPLLFRHSLLHFIHRSPKIYSVNSPQSATYAAGAKGANSSLLP